MAQTLTPPANTVKEPEKPKWVSIEEAERFEKMLLKQYVKKGDEEDAKKFFYRIISINPYQPGGIPCGTEDQLYQFNVQKYYRGKTRKVTRRDEKAQAIDVEDSVQVDQHEMRNGKWVNVDQTANFFMDCRKFKEEFTLDTTE